MIMSILYEREWEVEGVGSKDDDMMTGIMAYDLETNN